MQPRLTQLAAAISAGLAITLAACSSPAPTAPAAPTSQPTQAAAAKPAATTAPAAAPTAAVAAPKPTGAATSSAPAAAATGAAAPRLASPVKVELHLDWIAQGYHAPYFIALEKGWYKDAGLDVTITPGKGSADALSTVGAAQAQFGIADGATMVKAISEGTPVEMVASVLQETPIVIISDPEKNIKQPKDLEGKSLGVVQEAAETKVLPAFAKKNSVDLNKIQVVNYTFATRVPSFLTNKVDAINGYVQGEYLDAVTGAPERKFDVMRFSDNGIHVYSNGIIVNDDFAKSNPDATRAFVQVSMRGLQYTLDHLDEAIDASKKHTTDIDTPTLKQQFAVVIPMIDTEDARKSGFGSMRQDKWDETQQLMLDYGDQKSKVPLEQIYSTEFLK